MNCMEIMSHFQYEGDIIDWKPYGEGHINETFLITTSCKRYILQRINHTLFQDVPSLMHNIELVTSFIKKSYGPEKEDLDRLCLSFVYTKDHQPFAYDQGEYYRLYVYIENSVCYQRAENAHILYQSARAFGDFVARLEDFDARSLIEIIPHFHDTEKRYQDFLEAVRCDSCHRKADVESEISFFIERKDYCTRITNLLKNGTMPYRVTHNDTKLNNVLFDADDGHPLAVIDLDTIMPGSVCYDFGDSIRFGCSTALEDEQDLSKVHFDLQLFRSYAQGFLETAGPSLKNIEIDYLAFSAILMTYECGMRFLGDYLNGDCYFRISRPQQNLDRASTHIKLIKEMEEHFTEMKLIIEKCCRFF